MACAEERTREIHVQHRAPFLEAQLEQRLHEIADSGIVDDDVEAPEGIHGALHRSDYLRLVANVERRPDRLCASRTELLDDRIELGGRADAIRGHVRCRFAEIADDDGSALRGQPPADRLAETAVSPRAGDQRDFAGKATRGGRYCSHDSGFLGDDFTPAMAGNMALESTWHGRWQ